MCGCLCFGSKQKGDTKREAVIEKNKCLSITSDTHQSSDPYELPARVATNSDQATLPSPSPPPPPPSSSVPIESATRSIHRMTTTEQDQNVVACGTTADAKDAVVDVPEAKKQEMDVGSVEVPNLHLQSSPLIHKPHDDGVPVQFHADMRHMMMPVVLVPPVVLMPLDATSNNSRPLSLRLRAHRQRLLRSQVRPEEDTLYEIAPIMPDVDLD